MLVQAAAVSIRALTAWLNYGGRINFESISQHIYSQRTIKHSRISILGSYYITCIYQ